MQFANLAELIPEAILDIRYATTNNITGKVLYAPDQAIPRLEATAAQALRQAAAAFKTKQLQLVIWDGYRPPEVQQQLRALDDTARYVLEDSMHCKGLAIDITLASLDGTYLDMGTDFDEFSPKAHPDAAGLSPDQLANRALLIQVMEQAGFKVWPYEWWHFDFLG